jgi:poly(A) polymerase
VGGCVRDTIQGRTVNDIDIATDALPSEVIKLAKTAGLRVLETGLSHGSITLMHKGDFFEVTTFRSDLKTDGRHSKVEFSKNIEDDAKRRDFTMNAIYMTIDAEVIDPILGWEDLMNGHVRFIGDPEERIQEDYLRILRYFRFLTIYESDKNHIIVAALAACSRFKHGLKKLSKERIWQELQKILSYNDCTFALQKMESSGVLEEILPFSKTKTLERFLVFENKISSGFKEIDRLAALNISHVNSWVKKLSLTKEQKKWVRQILVIAKDVSSLRVKGYKYKENLALSALGIIMADSTSSLSQNDIAEIKFGASQKFPLDTSDFMKFFPPSKELGDQVKRVTKIWFDSELTMSREELLAQLNKYPSL